MRPSKPIRLIDIFMPPTLPQSPKSAPRMEARPRATDTLQSPEKA
jgi:hypothetical protein